ncbi:hypothetical protein [uncultured Microscilla sp.]|uniref:hypothetical protein n=1 Tax=uncultured Microscilla sp. TaxID=432653 RepID=UPI002635AD82|nr:hypothetical protein [uncultured Microscilla sp.]
MTLGNFILFFDNKIGGSQNNGQRGFLPKKVINKERGQTKIITIIKRFINSQRIGYN